MDMLGEALAGQDTWRAAFQDVPLQTRAELLATFLVPGAFGLLFYGMFLRSRHESFGIIPGGAFALTLALSLNMLVLAIMEVVSWYSFEIRFALWRFDLGGLAVMQVLVLPALLTFAMLREQGLDAATAGAGSCLVTGAYMVAYYHLGVLFPITAAEDTGMLSLEGNVGRLGVLGVTTSAALAGFGGVMTPATWLPQLNPSVPRAALDDSVAAVRRLQRELASVLRRHRSALAEAEALGPEAAEAAAAVTLHGVGPFVLDLDGAAESGPEGGLSPVTAHDGSGAGAALRQRIHGAGAADPERGVPSPSPPVSGSKAPARGAGGCCDGLCRWLGRGKLLPPAAAAAVDRALATREQAVTLRALLSDEVRVFKDVRARALAETRAGTPWGRLLQTLGTFLLLYTVVKTVMSVRGVLFSIDPQTDMITRVVREGSRYLDLPPAVEAAVQPLSFLVVGIIVVSSTQGFLVNFAKVFRAVASKQSNGSFALGLAFVMAAYFVSVVLLMRMAIPEEYRDMLTRALGGVHFMFFHRWFDIVYTASVAVVAATLVIQRRNYQWPSRSNDMAAPHDLVRPDKRD